MKRILGFAILLALFSLPLLAAKSSQVFLLPSDVRIGDVQLPEGHCTVTWSEMTGPQVQLTIKTGDGKSVTIPAKLIVGKQRDVGVETAVVNGVTYLLAFHSPDAHVRGARRSQRPQMSSLESSVVTADHSEFV